MQHNDVPKPGAVRSRSVEDKLNAIDVIVAEMGGPPLTYSEHVWIAGRLSAKAHQCGVTP